MRVLFFATFFQSWEVVGRFEIIDVRSERECGF